MSKSAVSLRLDAETQARLEALAKTRDRTPHYLMKAAVERFLEVEEAQEAERRLVKARWESFALTGEAIDHAEVEAWVSGLGAASGDKTR